jgi:hypothetical protein
VRTDITVEDVQSFLDAPLVAILATLRADGSVLLSPVWHEWHDGGPRQKRETASHADNRPEKSVLSVVELTLRARSSALAAKATEARPRRGAQFEAMIETPRG